MLPHLCCWGEAKGYVSCTVEATYTQRRFENSAAALHSSPKMDEHEIMGSGQLLPTYAHNAHNMTNSIVQG